MVIFKRNKKMVNEPAENWDGCRIAHARPFLTNKHFATLLLNKNIVAVVYYYKMVDESGTIGIYKKSFSIHHVSSI
eukprot:785950-Ditylum_brightwellii.AAC.1